MKTNDYVKYITQTVVQYIDQPKDERKKLRQEKRDVKLILYIDGLGLFRMY